MAKFYVYPVLSHPGVMAFELSPNLKLIGVGRKAFSMSASQGFRLSIGGARWQSAGEDFWIGVSSVD